MLTTKSTVPENVRMIIVHIGLLLFGFLLLSCTTFAQTSTATARTSLSTNTDTIATSTSESPGGFELDPRYSGILSLIYGSGEEQEIWTLRPPYERPLPFAKNGGYYYGYPIWSPGGELLAFSKTKPGCPIPYSGIWIAEYDGNHAIQLGEPIKGTINDQTGNCDLTLQFPAIPISFVNGDQAIAVQFEISPFVLEIGPSDYSLIDIGAEIINRGLWINEDASLIWSGISSNGERGLLTSYPRGEPRQSLFLIDFRELGSIKFLHPASDFSYDDFGYLGLSNDWSPSATSIVVPERKDDEAQLWLANVETDEWRVVAQVPLEDIQGTPSQVLWSPDGRWIAWFSWAYDDIEGIYNPQIMILDASNWSEIDTIELVEAMPLAKVLQWVTLDNGESRLAISQLTPGGGIFLLNPLSPETPSLFVPYDVLISPEKELFQIGPFQPRSRK